MGLFLWDSEPSKIFVWDTPISKVFLWDTQVRPSYTPWPWQPWANTLVYLPLATNSNDQSWNWNNGTDTNITYTDWKAVFNSSGTSCILLDTTSLPNTFTLHMIIARQVNSGYQVAFRYSDNLGYDNSRCYISGYGTYTDWWVIHQQTDLSVCNSSVRVNKWLVDTDTNEHLRSFVVYEDSGYTYIRFFIDGVQLDQQVASTHYYTGAKLSLWNRWYNPNEWLKGTMREVIMESTKWTDAEVLALAQQYGFA